jgi:hypothetical protein
MRTELKITNDTRGQTELIMAPEYGPNKRVETKHISEHSVSNDFPWLHIVH